jgi:hypothetical protein
MITKVLSGVPINICIAYSVGVLRKLNKPLQTFKDSTDTGSNRASQIHASLRMCITSKDFLLKAEEANIKILGMHIALEVLSENVLYWSLDDSILEIIHIFDTKKLSAGELIAKVKALAVVRDKMMKSSEPYKFSHQRHIVEISIKKTIEQLNQACHNNELTYFDAQSYV